LELAVSEVDHLGLFTGILRDISRRQALERQVVEIAAQEDQRIGRELHDSVGQELTGLGMMAGALARRLEHGSGAEKELAGKLVQGLNRVHQQVRALSRELIVAELDAEGLSVALEELAARTREQAGIDCHLDSAEPVSVPDPLMAKHLYRVAQEAVSNALRHGKPSRICLALHSGPDELCLTIRDDGIGMQKPVVPPQADPTKDGMGIPTMHYRAAMIGGALQVGPAPGGGTLVSCSVPRRIHHGQG
jgi:signal transduction histidine kinase